MAQLKSKNGKFLRCQRKKSFIGSAIGLKYFATILKSILGKRCHLTININLIYIFPNVFFLHIYLRANSVREKTVVFNLLATHGTPEKFKAFGKTFSKKNINISTFSLTAR